MRKRLSAVITTVTATVAVLGGTPTAAHATLTGVQCPAVVRYAPTNEQVVICQGFDTTTGMGPYTIAGYGELAAYQGVTGYPASGVHVQIDRINLGSPYGVLASGGPFNGQTGFVSGYTGRTGYDCADSYRVRLYLSIRWSNGVLSSGIVGPLTHLQKCTTPALAGTPEVAVPQVINV